MKDAFGVDKGDLSKAYTKKDKRNIAAGSTVGASAGGYVGNLFRKPKASPTSPVSRGLSSNDQRAIGNTGMTDAEFDRGLKAINEKKMKRKIGSKNLSDMADAEKKAIRAYKRSPKNLKRIARSSKPVATGAAIGAGYGAWWTADAINRNKNIRNSARRKQ